MVTDLPGTAPPQLHADRVVTSHSAEQARELLGPATAAGIVRSLSNFGVVLSSEYVRFSDASFPLDFLTEAVRSLLQGWLLVAFRTNCISAGLIPTEENVKDRMRVQHSLSSEAINERWGELLFLAERADFLILLTPTHPSTSFFVDYSWWLIAFAVILPPARIL